MKRLIVLAVAFVAGHAGCVYADIHGAWTASFDSKRPTRIYLNLARNGWQYNGNSTRIADFAGLTSSQIESGTQVPVQFRLAREAGTISFEGTFKRGDGAGQFSFDPNPSYVATLRSLGVDFEMRRHRGKSEEESLFSLTLLDVSTSYIRSMLAEGYRETLDTFVEMRLFNVTPDFIHQLKDAGYSNVPAKKLVALKIHGIDIEYIRRMNAIE
jgi:hypothetical protein